MPPFRCPQRLKYTTTTTTIHKVRWFSISLVLGIVVIGSRSEQMPVNFELEKIVFCLAYDYKAIACDVRRLL